MMEKVGFSFLGRVRLRRPGTPNLLRLGLSARRGGGDLVQHVRHLTGEDVPLAVVQRQVWTCFATPSDGLPLRLDVEHAVHEC